jgi:hypothetical protein
MNPPPLPVAPPVPKSSALTAGWICLAIGFVTFWIFGLGFAFFSIAMICAVVAICTNQVQRGLILLLSSFASLAMCAVIFVVAIFGTIFGAFGLAVQKARLNTSSLNPSFGRVSQLDIPVEAFLSQAQKAQQFHSPSPTPTP